MTDRITELYNKESLAEGSALPGIMGEVERDPALANWTGSYLSRPLFIEKREIEAFADDVLGLFDIITSLPKRLFDGDLDRYCDALGIDEERKKLIIRLGGVTPPRYGRADMYHNGTSFKLLEIGIASEVGGADRAGEIPARCWTPSRSRPSRRSTASGTPTPAARSPRPWCRRVPRSPPVVSRWWPCSKAPAGSPTTPATGTPSATSCAGSA